MSKKSFNLRNTVIAATATVGLLIAAPAFAGPTSAPGYGMGPGMMGGSEQECDMGPGMMGGHGYGDGKGSAMMRGHAHGYGMGSGMMGGQGHGMGPGMMGGMMGAGMMGGMGYGMMGYAGAPGLNLSDEQRATANKIHDASRKKMWGSMGGMLDASSKLRELLSAPTRDRAAISAAYKQIAELRQQMFEVGLDAQEDFARILTEDQRKQLRR